MKAELKDDKVYVAKIKLLAFHGVETLWEKEQMLATKIFSFSYNAYKSLL